MYFWLLEFTLKSSFAEKNNTVFFRTDYINFLRLLPSTANLQMQLLHLLHVNTLFKAKKNIMQTSTIDIFVYFSDMFLKITTWKIDFHEIFTRVRFSLSLKYIFVGKLIFPISPMCFNEIFQKKIRLFSEVDTAQSAICLSNLRCFSEKF